MKFSTFNKVNKIATNKEHSFADKIDLYSNVMFREGYSQTGSTSSESHYLRKKKFPKGWLTLGLLSLLLGVVLMVTIILSMLAPIFFAFGFASILIAFIFYLVKRDSIVILNDKGFAEPNKAVTSVVTNYAIPMFILGFSVVYFLAK